MKIKLKTKHIFYSFIGVIVLFLGVFYILLPHIEYLSAKHALKNEKENAEEKMLSTLNNPYLFKQNKYQLLESYVLSDQYLNDYDVMVGPSLISWQTSTMTFQTQDLIPYIHDYVENAPINGFYEHALSKLTAYYKKENKLSEIDGLFQVALDRKYDDTYIYHEVKLQYAKYKVATKAYTEAADILDELSDIEEAYDIKGRAALEEAKLAELQDDSTQAKEIINTAIQDYKKSANLEMESAEELPNISTTLNELEKYKEQLNGSLVDVEGVIEKSDGSPLENVGVYIREEKDVNRTYYEEEFYQTSTDDRGHYKIKNMPQGKYQITLGLTYNQIDGWMWPVELDDWLIVEDEPLREDIVFEKLINIQHPSNQEEIKSGSIHFAWDEVKDAAYYELEFGISHEGTVISTVFREKFTENDVDIPIESLYLHEFSRLFSDDDISEISSENLLGFLNTEGNFTWSVSAYDDKDKLLTSSKGYRLAEDTIGEIPMFQLKARILNEADISLLKGNAKRALKEYEERYEKDEDDIESLLMITRLINIEDEGKRDFYVKALLEKIDDPDLAEFLE